MTSGGGGVRFGILGDLEVTVDHGRLEFGGPKQRGLLAMLLIHLNQSVSAGRLTEALWGSEPPSGAEVTLRTHVSHLRRHLASAGAADVLVTRRSGYSLALDPEQVDAYRFERLAGLGQEAVGLGDPERAAQLLRDALELWRGPVLQDLGRPVFADAETARLDGLRLDALEARICADLAVGRYDVISELERLVIDHPFRERFHGQLMLALYRAGRQADALAAYASARERLADELGLDPGPALAELETAILRGDPALLLPGAQTASPSQVKAPPDALFSSVRRDRMVGRSGELDRLCDLWQEVREGAARVVLVSGEAGVGKTRLVAEFAHSAAADEPRFLVGRCDQAEIPYQPIVSALPESAEIVASAPEVMRNRFAGLLAQLAPVVLVLEDAERIDHASAELVRHVLRQLPARVLVIVCFRDPPGTRHPALLELLGDLPVADRVVLQPLSESDLGSLVGDQPAEFVRELWRSTGGNPFYAGEVVRDLKTRNGQFVVPSGVRDVLRHRLQALPAEAQQVVRCAAVLGREAEFGLLAQLVDLAEDPLIDALDQAVGAGFLVEAGSSWKATYSFPHDLMREAVYGDIPQTRRQRLHVRAAEALQLPGATVAAAAVHLRAAGPAADPEQAADLSLQAADEAARLYAWHEAVAHAEAAVDVLDQAGATPDRRAAAAVETAILRLKSSIGDRRAIELLETALELYAGDDVAAATVHGRLGGALCTNHSVMDIPRAIDHLAAAERLNGDRFHLHRGMSQAAMYGVRTEVLGDAARRAEALAADLGRRDLSVMASWGRAWYEFNRGQLLEAATIREAMWATAHELADPYLGWTSVSGAALSATEYLLDPVAGRAWCRRGLAQARFETFEHPHDTIVDQLALALAAMGDLDEAHRVAAPLPADAVSRRILTFLDGDWERAEQDWAAALRRDEEAGDFHDAALNARWLGGVRRLLGDQDGAVAALRRAVTIGVEGPQLPTELAARAELAQVLAESGGLAEAAVELERCDGILAAGEDWRGLGGVVELARGAVTGADDAYRRAVEIFTTYRLSWRRAAALKAWGR
ncbi:BTAD domain-containing putative transcriptional regulator [Kribbella sp. NPDC049174]|uniref:BTAD domain-containing putative transcriptional regulator n=1 Tax=Kribbella sp. NPDC049174 TaxID=3364112 RepID=UPI003724397F